MAEYQLYCFAQSGNAYRAALMLNLIGADWEPVFVDFFGKAVQRTPEWRADVNEMGEVPVLVKATSKLTQSGVILTYLSEQTGQFTPRPKTSGWKRCAGSSSTTRSSTAISGRFASCDGFAKPAGDPAVLAFLKGRIDNNLAIVEKRLAKAPFCVGDHPTIADISLCGYHLLPRRGVRIRYRRRRIRISESGSSASRRCPAGNIPTT